MAQIGVVKVETGGGPVELPVLEPGDSESDVYEMWRVETASGPGFIPLTDPTNADRPYLRVQTANHGVLAAHTDFTSMDRVDDFTHDDLTGNYDGSTDEFTIVSAETPNSSSRALRADGSSIAQNIYTTGGTDVPLDRWPDSGDNISYFLQDSTNGFTRMTFKKNGNTQVEVRTSGRDDFIEFTFMGQTTQTNQDPADGFWQLVNIEITSGTNTNDEATMTMYNGQSSGGSVWEQISHTYSGDRTGTYDRLEFGDGDSATYYGDIRIGLR